MTPGIAGGLLGERLKGPQNTSCRPRRHYTPNFIWSYRTSSLTKTAVSALVTYAVKVQNDSTVGSLELATLVDDKFGDIASVHDKVLSTTCSLPATIAVGDSYTCSFTATVDSSPHINKVSGTVWDDENNPVNPPPSDSATVTLQ